MIVMIVGRNKQMIARVANTIITVCCIYAGGIRIEYDDAATCMYVLVCDLCQRAAAVAERKDYTKAERTRRWRRKRIESAMIHPWEREREHVPSMQSIGELEDGNDQTYNERHNTTVKFIDQFSREQRIQAESTNSDRITAIGNLPCDGYGSELIQK